MIDPSLTNGAPLRYAAPARSDLSGLSGKAGSLVQLLFALTLIGLSIVPGPLMVTPDTAGRKMECHHCTVGIQEIIQLHISLIRWVIFPFWTAFRVLFYLFHFFDRFSLMVHKSMGAL